MSGQHARCSASAAHRWMVCAGSIGSSGDASIHAAQGTFAHDIASKCLKDSSLSPSDFFLQKAVVDGFEVECDLEMERSVRFYIDTLDSEMQEGDVVWIEMPLLDDLKTIDKDLGGTADYVRYRPATRELLVCDFKYGAGVYVEVVGNQQLKLYALGALLNVLRSGGHKVDTVRSMVIQPRYDGAAPVREDSFRAIDLLGFAADVKDAAEKTRLPNPPLVAGDHCRFCPKSRTCTELEARQHALIKADLGEVVDVQQLSALLVSVPLVKARLTAIEEYAYKLAAQGVDIPDHKLVDKTPRRKWKSEGEVVLWAQEHAIDPYAPREVLSPAQLEKKVAETAPRGKKKEAAKVLELFVERVSSGTVLVHVSDSRPAVKRVDEKDFAVVDGAVNAEVKSVVNLF